VPIGVPCTAAMQPSSHRYFFVHVLASAAPNTAEGTKATAAADALAPQTVPIAGLELGPLLGRSPYGSTFRACHKGTPVAVKVLFCHKQKCHPHKPALQCRIVSTQGCFSMPISRCLSCLAACLLTAQSDQVCPPYMIAAGAWCRCLPQVVLCD
jgi:hypothetical protein